MLSIGRSQIQLILSVCVDPLRMGLRAWVRWLYGYIAWADTLPLSTTTASGSMISNVDFTGSDFNEAQLSNQNRGPPSSHSESKLDLSLIASSSLD